MQRTRFFAQCCRTGDLGQIQSTDRAFESRASALSERSEAQAVRRTWLPN